MDNIKIILDGVEYEIEKGMTILEAAKSVNVEIPTLCYLKKYNESGSCRMCLVEVKGMKGLVTACTTKVSEGMEILTNTEKVEESRKFNLELICSNHRMDCNYCPRFPYCELNTLCRKYGIDDRKYKFSREMEYEKETNYIVRDNSKCILCHRCESICSKVQGIGAIGTNGRGYEVRISGGANQLPLTCTECINCGQCVAVCPTGALMEKEDTREVRKAIVNPKKHVIAIMSSVVAVQLGECFREPVGEIVEGKMIAALHRIGFDKVFNLNYAKAEVSRQLRAELLEHWSNGNKNPIFTSKKCPSWITYCEKHRPDLLSSISKIANPQQIMASLCKSKYAEKEKIDPQNIVVVYISSCTAAKSECLSSEFQGNVDYAITTNELYRMFKRSCISSYTAFDVWDKLPSEEFDSFIIDKEIEVDEIDNIREITLKGIGNAVKFLNTFQQEQIDYDIIEVLACPGGCINGGGQPRHSGMELSFDNIISERDEALYTSKVR